MRVSFVSDRVSNQLQFRSSHLESKVHRLTDSFGFGKAPTFLKAAPAPEWRECYPLGYESFLGASEFMHAGNSPLSV